MNEKNYIRQPMVIVGLTVLILSALSFFPTDWKAAGVHLRPVDIFSDIRRPAIVPQNRPAATPISPKPRAAGIIDYGKQPEGAMAAFYRSLKNRQGRTRIAYYGDSMIEGDLITMDVRDVLQSQFGGRGVGFVPITSVTAGFRPTIRHTFSDDWKSVSLIEPSAERRYVGPSGMGFMPAVHADSLSESSGGTNSWVEYRPGKRNGASAAFDQVRIFYGTARARGSVHWDSRESNGTVVLEEGTGVRQAPIPLGRGSTFLRMEFSSPDSMTVYGASIESDTGVYVDNYSLRGNSGVPLAAIPGGVLKSFAQLLEYKLIVLQFGANVANEEAKGYEWYYRSMVHVVNYFQRTCPEASILIVGMGDKARKDGMTIATDPCIFPLIEVQRKVAEETHVAFWNLFDAMGGENTIAHWVSTRPPLAQSDFTHVTAGGAYKIGHLLTTALLDGYRLFQRRIH
jgi:hypothetical protein